MTTLAQPDLGPHEDLRIVRGLSVFPVRHHSPMAARLLAERLRARPPRVVLIEGPSDASAFISILADLSNEPPLALLSFRAGESKASYVHPFATFSPEYQAMATARELGVPVEFCDVPLIYREDTAPAPVPPGEPLPSRFDTTNLWEMEFEARQLSVDEYVDAAMELGRGTCALYGPAHADTRAREAYMMARAFQWVARGVAPEDIVLVCGAAHAGPLVDGDVDFAELRKLEVGPPVTAFVVPYSYARLSSVLGYGAGVPYPGFAQAVWDARGDAEAATCVLLHTIAGKLGQQGHAPSLADIIDGLTLAKNLAALRQRSAPGVPELVQAVESCLTRGKFGRAKQAVADCLVGNRVGRLVTTAGRSPLAVEFYAFVTHPRHSPPLIVSDRTLPLKLDLHSEAQREISTFLHRARIASLGFATAGKESGTWHEAWVLTWSPLVDLRLAEACEVGLSIEEVASHTAREAIAAAKRVEAAAHVFLDVVRAGLTTLVPESHAKVDERCLASDDVPDLCGAIWRLHLLVRYEGLTPELAELVRGLFRSVVMRALLCIAGLGALSDDDAREVAQGLSGLADIRDALEEPERALLDGHLEALALNRDVHALVAGAAAGLALLCEKLSMPLVAREVAGRLTGVGTEAAAMAFLEGLFAHQRRELVGTRALVAELRAFVERLPEDEFLRLLPALRRTFGKLERGELSLLLTTLAGCRKGKSKQPAAAALAASHVRADRELVRAFDRFERALKGEA